MNKLRMTLRGQVAPWIGILIVAILVVQSAFPNLIGHQEPKTTPVRDSLEQFANPSPTELSSFEAAQLLLRGGETQRANALLQQLWGSSQEAERESVALALALCAEAEGATQKATKWYATAAALARERDPQSQRAEFYRMMAHTQPGATDTLDAETSTFFVNFFPPAAPNEPRHEMSDKALALLKKAEERYERENKSTTALTLLMCWRFMVAELAADETEALYSDASTRFVEAWKTLRDLEEKLIDPDVAKKIKGDPTLSAMYEAVRSRLNVTLKRDINARQMEVKRLTRLRELILGKDVKDPTGKVIGHEDGYKDCLRKLVAAQTYQLSGGEQKATEMLGEVEETMVGIQKALTEPDKDKVDHYLLRDELARREEEKRIPLPFSDDTLLHTRVLQAWALYQKATADPNNVDLALLQQASQKVSEGFGGNGGRPVDTKNPFGYYVLAAISEAEGVAKTAPNPALERVHTEAKVAFDKARNALVETEMRLAQLPDIDPNTAEFWSELRRRKAELGNAGVQHFLDLAEKATQEGKPDEAVRILADGQHRWRDPKLWIAKAEAERRTGRAPEMILADWNKAKDAGVLNADDFRTVLIPAKTQLAMLESELPGIEDLPVERRTELAAIAKAAAEQLKAKSATEVECEAYRSLARVFATIFSPEDDPVFKIELEGIASDSEHAEQILRERLEQNATGLTTREALVASHLAQGYCASRALPDFKRMIVINQFTHAIDTAAKLPFRSKEISMLGNPLFAALETRTDGETRKHLEHELKLRRSMTYFVEGAVVLREGLAESAVEKMEAGLAVMKSQAPAVPSPSEEIGLENKLVGFAVLGKVATGKKEGVVEDAVHLVTGKQPEPEQVIPEAQKVLRGTGSPLVAYALGKALEQRASSFGVQQTPKRKAALGTANQAYSRTMELLPQGSDTPTTKGFKEMGREGLARLTKEWYLERGSKLEETFRLADASEAYQQGLRLFPESQTLWEKYIDGLLKLSFTETQEEEKYKRLVEEAIANMEIFVDDAQPKHWAWRATTYRELGQTDKAIEAIEKAEADPQAPQEERVSVAALRIQLELSKRNAAEE